MVSLLSEVGYDQVYLIFHIRKYIVKEVTVVWVVNAMGRHYLEEGNGNPLQYSCLENLLDRGAWWPQSMGSQRVGHDLATEQILSKEQIRSVTVYTGSNWEYEAHITSETYASFLTIFSLLIYSQNSVQKLRVSVGGLVIVFIIKHVRIFLIEILWVELMLKSKSWFLCIQWIRINENKHITNFSTPFCFK